jgi:hypothetical protein
MEDELVPGKRWMSLTSGGAADRCPPGPRRRSVQLDAVADELTQVRLMDGLNRYRLADDPDSL